MSTDSFYTSAELADTLISFCSSRSRPKLVADFACGGGSLLLAAERRWPGISVVANDISRSEIRKLQRNHDNWSLSSANFLDHRSVRSSKLRNEFGKIDLVLLNPPFSRRNKKTYAVEFNGSIFHVSIAAAFVVNSIPFLSKRGSLLAVLPDGCLISNADIVIWREIQKVFNFEVIRDNSRSAFHGVSARTCMIRMSRIRVQSHAEFPAKKMQYAVVKVERGSCQMHARYLKRADSSAELVHTSHLREGIVQHSGDNVFGKIVTGPAVLFPRVGRITPDKICFLEPRRSVVLSDCVLATRCCSESEALKLRSNVLKNWSDFAASYRGTGAPYITVERASLVLSKIVVSGVSENSTNVESNFICVS